MALLKRLMILLAVLLLVASGAPVGALTKVPWGMVDNKPVIDVTDSPFRVRGDGTTDDTAGIALAIASATAGTTLLFPQGGACKVTSPLTVNKAITIDLNGCTIKNHYASSSIVGVFNFEGSASFTQTLVTSPNAGSDTIVVPTISAFATGTWALIHSDKLTSSLAGDSGDGHRRDWVRVHSVDSAGAAIKIFGPTVYGAYTGSGPATISQFSLLQRPSVKNGSIEDVSLATSSKIVAVRFYRCEGAFVDRVETREFDYCGVYAEESVGCDISGSSFYRSNPPELFGYSVGAFAYGVVLDKVSYSSVRGCRFFTGRVAVTNTRTGSFNTYSGNECYGCSLDTHGGAFNSIVGNTVHGGFILVRASWTTISGNTIYRYGLLAMNETKSAIDVDAAGLQSGQVITNNVVYGNFGMGLGGPASIFSNNKVYAYEVNDPGDDPAGNSRRSFILLVGDQTGTVISGNSFTYGGSATNTVGISTYYTSGSQTKVTGNVFAGAFYRGIAFEIISEPMNDVDITGNFISTASESCIRFRYCNNLRISDNNLVGSYELGSETRGILSPAMSTGSEPYNILITDNFISSCSWGVRALTSTVANAGVTVRGNKFHKVDQTHSFAAFKIASDTLVEQPSGLASAIPKLSRIRTRLATKSAGLETGELYYDTASDVIRVAP